MVNTVIAEHKYPSIDLKTMFEGEEPVLSTGKTKRQKHKEFSFWEAEELGTVPPARCVSCTGCEKCTVRAQTMSTRDGVELKALEENTHYDREQKKVITNYPFKKDPSVLTDNYDQAVQLARGLEKRLIRSGMLEAYNEQLRDMLTRG